MGRGLYLALIIASVSAKANLPLAINKSETASWGRSFSASYSLLTTSTQDFDFRDENNNPVTGNIDRIKALFLLSAWNLLALGATPIKALQESLFEQGIPGLGALVVLAQKLQRKLITLATSIANSLRRLAGLLDCNRFRTHLPPTSTPRPLYQVLAPYYVGAATPLRL